MLGKVDVSQLEAAVFGFEKNVVTDQVVTLSQAKGEAVESWWEGVWILDHGIEVYKEPRAGWGLSMGNGYRMLQAWGNLGAVGRVPDPS